MNEARRAVVSRLPFPPANEPERESNWQADPWAGLPELLLDGHMGSLPQHFPRVAAKLGWDAEALYAIFRVEDRYVRAVTPHDQGSVCRDSCVEFFFCPGEDVSRGYFNIEVNCGGTVLFHFQQRPWAGTVEVDAAGIAAMNISRTLPRLVEPEIQEPVTWTIEYRVPFSVLETCVPIVRPRPGDVWRANLYKCADGTSHPHWLVWSPMARPRPDFHVPDQFGFLVFG